MYNMNNGSANGAMVDVHPATHTLAHFNPSELHTLVAAQGGPQYAPDGKLAFNNLDHMLHHPAVIPHVQDAINQAHFAGGGDVVGHMEQKMANEGTHGDNNLAWVPHRLSNTFDHAIGAPGGDVNPHTGLKQYWSLSGILDSAKKAISNPMDTMKKVVQSDTFRNLAGQAAQTGLGLAANKLGNVNSGNGLANFAAQAAGHLASNAANNIGQNGLSTNTLTQSGKQGLGNILQQGMNQATSHLTGQSAGPSVLTNTHLNMPSDGSTIAQKLGQMGSNIGGQLAGHAVGALNQHAGNLLGHDAYAPLGAALTHAGTNLGSNFGSQIGSHVGGVADQGINAVKARFAEHGGAMHPNLPAPMMAAGAPPMHNHGWGLAQQHYDGGGMVVQNTAPMLGMPNQHSHMNFHPQGGQAPMSPNMMITGQPGSYPGSGNFPAFPTHQNAMPQRPATTPPMPQRPNGFPAGQLTNMLMTHQASNGNNTMPQHPMFNAQFPRPQNYVM